MVNKPGKPKSKRTPVRLRHKIEKASAAKQRKERKLAKHNPEWRSRIKKDPGIPNLFPYKERILHDIEEKRRIKAEEVVRRRAENKQTHQEEEDAAVFSEEENVDQAMVDDDDTNPLAALVNAAQARASAYNDAEESDHEMQQDATADSSRKAFDKVYKDVLESSDIILYVLDARDPEGTRSREIEQQIITADKRLILVLNKIDLVPTTVLRAWLQHLRRSFPTLPLRANLPASNANVFDHKALTVKGTSETLLKALKAYAQTKRSTSVGIVGYPNVGKSSVVNALKSRLSGVRSSTVSAPVGAEAGVTTALRQVKLDNNLKLLDSPGIAFPSAPSPSLSAPPNMTAAQAHEAHLVLLSALPPSSIRDPTPAVALLIHRLSSSEMFNPMLEFYGIAAATLCSSDLTTDFLVQVARKRGRLGKGGVPNLNAAAMNVLVDWRDGRIRGWQEPPLNAPANDAKEIVTSWAKEFQLDGLWGSS